MFPTVRLTCVLALGALALSAQVAPAPTVETTAMIGIAQGQTARLNLLNPGALSPTLGVVCSAAVSYEDNNGNTLKTATVTVLPGRSGMVDLHSDTDLSLPVGERREIRAIIAVPAIVPPPTATSGGNGSTSSGTISICKMVITLEVFDSLTGRTQALTGKVDTLD